MKQFTKVFFLFLVLSPLMMCSKKKAPERPLARSVIDTTVKGHLARVQQCYEPRLQKNPNLVGTVVYGWEIEPSGNVVEGSVKAVEDPLQDQKLNQCVFRLLSGIQYPESDGGNVSVDSYPIQFSRK